MGILALGLVGSVCAFVALAVVAPHIQRAIGVKINVAVLVLAGLSGVLIALQAQGWPKDWRLYVTILTFAFPTVSLCFVRPQETAPASDIAWHLPDPSARGIQEIVDAIEKQVAEGRKLEWRKVASVMESAEWMSDYATWVQDTRVVLSRYSPLAKKEFTDVKPHPQIEAFRYRSYNQHHNQWLAHLCTRLQVLEHIVNFNRL